jgi:integrase
MPKITTLEPTFDRARKRWRLAVPASFSDTGKRRNLYFSTKTKAQNESDRLQNLRKIHGSEATILPAAIAIDAKKAIDALSKAGLGDISLFSLALNEIERHKLKTASKKLSEAWQCYLDHLDVKRTKKGYPIAERTKVTKRYLARPLLAKYGKKLVIDITKSKIERLLEGCTTPTQRASSVRHLSPFFGYCIKQKWCSENPFNDIEVVTGHRQISVATIEQVRRCFMACKDWRQDKSLNKCDRVNATGAKGGVALAFFAGVRPQEELPAVDWSDINFKEGTIRIKRATAKSRRGRTVIMEPTLREWLEQVPKSERSGSVCCANWARVWKRIRKFTGFEKGKDEDIARHSYATYHYKIHRQQEALRANLGHTTDSILFDHYVDDTEVTEQEAKDFWSITPSKPFTVVKSA